MKRLLIGGLAVGSMLFAATGVATASTSATIPNAPVSTDLANPAITADAWPLVATPGSLSVSFDTPSSALAISGYTVVCTAPALSSDGAALYHSLPPIAASFVVDASTGTSADTDYSNTGGRVTLVVGPYSVAATHALPPLLCTVIASNAKGSSKPLKLNKVGTSVPPSSTCAYDETSDGLGQGLLVAIGGGDLSPILGVSPSGLPNHIEPIAPATTSTGATTFSQTSSNFDVVIADLSGLGGGPTPYCSTNAQYNEHILSNQPVAFSQLGTKLAAVTTGSASKLHPKQVAFSNIGLTATVKAGIPLNVASSDVVYAFDNTHFSIDSCTGGTSCTITAAAQPALGLPAAPTGAAYVIVHDAATHVIAPGKPIVGAKIKLTVSKRQFLQVAAVACDKWVGPLSAGCVPVVAAAGPYPATFGLTLATAITVITVGSSTLPIQLTAPGNFVFAVSGGTSHGGDTNYLSHVVEASSSDL